MINDLLTGARYLITGFTLAKQPHMRRYIIAPLLVNVLFFIGMGFVFFGYIDGLVAHFSFDPQLPDGLSWLQSTVDTLVNAFTSLIWLIVGFVFLFITAYTFTGFAHLIASPFNGLLAEKIEKSLHTTHYPSHTLTQIAGRTFVRELQRLWYWLFKALGLLLLTLVLSVIPLINLISPVLWFVFGAWFMAIQYIDYPADNNGLNFKHTLQQLRQKRYIALGFGAATACLTVIPIINLIVLPTAISAAVALWVDHLAPSESTQTPRPGEANAPRT